MIHDEAEPFKAIDILSVWVSVPSSVRGEDPLAAKVALPIRKRAGFGIG